VISSRKNKGQNSQKHVSRNECFFNLIKKQFPTTCTFTKSCFPYNWYTTFTTHVLNLITVDFLLFISSQFTTNAQNLLCLNQFMHWTRLHVDCRNMSNVSGQLRMVWET